jgi:hypothetical protein
MAGNDDETIAKIRDYLLERFDQVEIAPQRDARTGSALIAVWQGSTRRVVELTDVFLDADADLPHPVDAVRGGISSERCRNQPRGQSSVLAPGAWTWLCDTSVR